ncbi:MAG: type VI secretion system-associated protein TagF [Pelomonas sp.]|nr:type VI secretion system-associated protein TagF [Roseateles sp.]
MLTPDSIAGWYGKLPALGDFAQRRLPPEFVEAWDAWLAEGIAQWQSADPAWLDKYLAGPSWRFVLAPGVLDEQAWVGVLVPSCDRVGRYFPLTLAAPLAALPADADAAAALLAWLLRLDDLAVDAMLEEWPVERFEDEIARLAPPQPLAAPPSALAERIAGESAARGRGFWVMHGELADQLHVAAGLPRGAALAALLSGTPEFG